LLKKIISFLEKVKFKWIIKLVKLMLIVCNANDCEVVATLIDGISRVTLYFNNDWLSFDGKDTTTVK